MNTSSADQLVSRSADEPTMISSGPEIPVTLVLSPDFMDTWTPLPDHTCQQMGNLGKITTHKVHRHNRLQHNTIDYKASTFAYSSEAQQFIEAAQSADKARLLKMLSAGTEVNIADSKGRTALHVSASKGFTDIVTMLLKYNANPNLLDVNGNTPFHLAVCANHAVVMTLLIGAGCKMDVHGRPGVYPIGLVRNRMRRLQANTKFTLHEITMERVKTLKFQQALNLKQRHEEERRSSEVMAELSCLSLRVSANDAEADSGEGSRPTPVTASFMPDSH